MITRGSTSMPHRRDAADLAAGLGRDLDGVVAAHRRRRRDEIEAEERAVGAGRDLERTGEAVDGDQRRIEVHALSEEQRLRPAFPGSTRSPCSRALGCRVDIAGDEASVSENVPCGNPCSGWPLPRSSRRRHSPRNRGRCCTGLARAIRRRIPRHPVHRPPPCRCRSPTIRQRHYQFCYEAIGGFDPKPPALR